MAGTRVTNSDTAQTAASTSAQEFLAFLAATNKGRTATELTTALQELVEAVRTTGKGGTLTYKLAIKPIDNSASQDGAVKVTDEIALKLPQQDRATSIFFVDEHSNLVRHNPNQRAFDFGSTDR